MAESLFALVDWLQANPALSAPLFVLVFCLVMAVGIPGGWFLLTSAGFLFGTFCLLYTSPSPRDRTRSRMPSSA